MKSDFSKLKVGEKLSFTTYVTVDKIDKKNGEILVAGNDGSKFTVRGKDLIQSFNSNVQYSDTVKLGKNEIADKLQSAGDKIFTVEYVKADGANRLLTGHFLSSEPNLGCSNVIDLEVTSGHNMRQVDHRTIKSIILNGTKYVAK